MQLIKIIDMLIKQIEDNNRVHDIAFYSFLRMSIGNSTFLTNHEEQAIDIIKKYISLSEEGKRLIGKSTIIVLQKKKQDIVRSARTSLWPIKKIA